MVLLPVSMMTIVLSLNCGCTITEFALRLTPLWESRVCRGWVMSSPASRELGDSAEAATRCNGPRIASLSLFRTWGRISEILALTAAEQSENSSLSESIAPSCRNQSNASHFALESPPIFNQLLSQRLKAAKLLNRVLYSSSAKRSASSRQFLYMHADSCW